MINKLIKKQKKNGLSNFDISPDDLFFVEDSEKDIEKHIDVKEKETLTEKNEAKKEFEKEENEQEGDNISLESLEADKIIQEEMQLKKGPSLGLIEEDENGESDSDIKKRKKEKTQKRKVQ